MPAKGEQTRQDIVEAAKALFYQRGYTNTSFSDIVEATGVQRGNIYHYFKSKEDILEAVIEQRIAEYEAILAGWDQKYADPRDRLHRYVQRVAANKGELAKYGCPIGTLGAELGKESCKLREPVRRLFDVFRDWLAAQFRQLGRSRQARALALHLLGRTEGISVMAHVYSDPALITSEVGRVREWIDAL
ncbi:MAG: TetR/AcrR family transcriptional regulator [Gammaproteobacteria bacterium]|jgi:AcrR family transcriptional regulator